MKDTGLNWSPKKCTWVQVYKGRNEALIEHRSLYKSSAIAWKESGTERIDGDEGSIKVCRGGTGHKPFFRIPWAIMSDPETEMIGGN